MATLRGPSGNYPHYAGRSTLEGVRVAEYSIALYELKLIADLLRRARAYVERSHATDGPQLL